MTYRTAADRIRWFSFLNDTNETIPGFAIMSLKNAASDNFPDTNRARDGQLVWHIRKPSAEDEALQLASRHCFNGPTNVPPGRYGRCTFDLPAQVLHDGRNDSMGYSTYVGPKADSWYVWSTRGAGAFLGLGHDRTQTYQLKGKTLGETVHVAWIGSAMTAVTLSYAHAVLGSSIYAGEVAQLSSSTLQGVTVEERDEGHSFKVAQRGTYHVTLHATIKGTDTERGDLLWLGVKHTLSISTPTLFSVTREQLAIYDEYDNIVYRDNQNVAGACAVELDDDAEVWVANLGAFDLSVTHSKFALHRLTDISQESASE